VGDLASGKTGAKSVLSSVISPVAPTSKVRFRHPMNGTCDGGLLAWRRLPCATLVMGVCWPESLTYFRYFSVPCAPPSFVLTERLDYATHAIASSRTLHTRSHHHELYTRDRIVTNSSAAVG